MINIDVFVEHIKSIKPASAKGNYMQKVVISSTMGPGFSIDWKK
jgi:large subunit ribosomal protein L1